MPRKNGFEVLQEIRRVSDVPVIMLTARGEEIDQVRGLELGADDYVVKPFSHLALLARIKAVLRRAELPPPAQALPDFVAGDLAINFQNQQVTVGGEPVKLTPVEYKLLYHLVRNAGRLMPHQALLDRVWGADYGATEHYLKVFISRLRAKLERPGRARYIETERGLGYRFVRPTEPAPHRERLGAGASPPAVLGRSRQCRRLPHTWGRRRRGMARDERRSPRRARAEARPGPGRDAIDHGVDGRQRPPQRRSLHSPRRAWVPSVDSKTTGSWHARPGAQLCIKERLMTALLQTRTTVESSRQR